jgi:hypothetical protein
MFHVIYRWRVHEGKESQFEQSWAEVTRMIRAHRGGLGSRLHRCPDGTYVAYARWPDHDTWHRSGSIPLPDDGVVARMKEAIASSEPPIQMTAVADLLG